jgi:glycosyltransferase involved in cell wall biosynthesis
MGSPAPDGHSATIGIVSDTGAGSALPASPGHMPLVTIVTPSFNQGEFIADAIDSVLAQDYPAIEYLVMDGGSTDGTIEVLRGYGDRVRWTSAPDKGQTDAIHRGFLAGSGEYLAWLNSDDRYVPGAIGAAVAELMANPAAGLVYGKGEFIGRDGTGAEPCAQIEPWDLGRLVEAVNFILQPATVFRRTAYLEIGGLDPGLHYVMDYDLWIRLGTRYPVRFLPRVLAQARVYGDTKTSTGGLPRMEELERMVRRNGGRHLPATYRREMWQALRGATMDAARRRRPLLTLRLAVRSIPYAAEATRRRTRGMVRG